MARDAAPVWTDFTKTRREGSCTPRMYVGPGICNKRTTSSFVDEILSDVSFAGQDMEVDLI